MSIKYIVNGKGNPTKPSQGKKFYATTKTTGDTTTRQLARELTRIYPKVSDSEALKMLKSLSTIMCKYLNEGRIIRLGNFGSFQVSISCKGMPSSEEVNETSIKGAKINFRPGADAKKMLVSLEYEKLR